MKKNFSPHETKSARAERALLEALHHLEDEARSCSVLGNSDPTAEAAHSACATVERYAGLSLAASGARADGEPTESELEPARVAGLAGTDLEVAGLCVHRRNVARLQAHGRRARVELLHALADLPDNFAASLAARPSDFRASRRLFAALLPTYARAIELLRVFDDAAGAQTVARLFDTANARLVQLDALARRDAPAASTGEQRCTPHKPQPGIAPPLSTLPTRPTTLTRA